MRVYYARYEVGDGPPLIEGTQRKWYLSWAREWPSGWSVDRTYLLYSIATLRDDVAFWELPWSACKHDCLIEEDAMSMMRDIHRTRMAHGYELTGSGIAIYDSEDHLTSTEGWEPDE